MSTAVVLVSFNRVDNAVVTANVIRKHWGGDVVSISDGARLNRNETGTVSTCRREVEETLGPLLKFKIYSDANLGCRRRIQSGLDEAFRVYERLIVLEDDCVPGRDFFEFASQGLRYMETAPSVAAVSGTLFQTNAASAFVSPWFGIWGWATTRAHWNAVAQYRVGSLLDAVRVGLKVRPLSLSPYVLYGLRTVLSRKVDSWDYEWMAGALACRRVCLYPGRNLVRNIGVGGQSTNTKASFDVPELSSFRWDGARLVENREYHMERLRRIIQNKISK